ncbi:MAG: T9SS type A sorting domain-containing protein [Bacteroidetes bacterium]|nr:T9SS type A sorting domain-containing protein [Bacteroidota bacterium]
MLRTLFFLILSLSLSAQNLQLAWFTQSDNINVVDSEMDPFGNIILAGTFTGIVDFDHGPHARLDTADGIYDMFVAKYDPYGNLLWAHSLGNNNPEKIKAIDVDANGNIYAVGEFTRSMDFDPGPGVTTLSVVGFADIFLWALKPNGDLLFAKSFGDGSLESPNDISVNDQGEIAMTGFFWGNGDMDPTTGYAPVFNNGLSDIFVLRLSSSGSILWVRYFGASKEDQGLNVEMANNGEIFLQGFYKDSVDFDPDTNATETFYLDETVSGGGFYLHLSPQGTFQSAFSNTLVPQHMKLLNNTELLFSGFFSGSQDFDPDSTGSFNLNAVGAQNPMFAWKLDTAWNFAWAKMWNSASLGKSSMHLSRDGSEGIVLSGTFTSSIDLDPGTAVNSRSSQGFEDVFVAHIDSVGDYLYGETWGSSNTDYPGFAMVNSNGELYLAGRFFGTQDFDPDPAITDNGTAISLQSYLLKMTYCNEVYGYDTITACNSYRWINNYHYNDNSNGDRYILQSPGGCDSLVFLNLTINFIDSSAYQLNDSTLAARQGLATYQWINCNTGLAIPGATAGRFVPDTAGNYAVIVSTTNCVDTSACLSFNIPISVKEIPFPKMLSAYPNPSSGIVTLQSDFNFHDTQILITDLQGKVLYKDLIKSGFEYQFELPEEKGIYLVHLLQEDHRQSLRLIKN